MLSGGVLNIVLTQTQFGQDWRWRAALCVLLALCLALAGRVWKQPLRWLGFAASVVFVASLAGGVTLAVAQKLIEQGRIEEVSRSGGSDSGITLSR